MLTHLHHNLSQTLLLLLWSHPTTSLIFFFQAVMPSSNDKETVSLVGPVAGAAAGCSVIFFIIGGLFVW